MIITEVSGEEMDCLYMKCKCWVRQLSGTENNWD